MPQNTPNVIYRDDGCILIKNVRLSYPHLWEKWGKEEDKQKRYSGKFFLDKKTHAADIKTLGAHIASLMTEYFKGRIGNDKLFMRDGDQLGRDDTMGQWVIAASEVKRKPNVINRDRSPVSEEDDIVYAGCYVNVLLRPWKQENKFGKRVNANLLSVQFVKDGERFSGMEAPDVEDAFDDISGEFEGSTDNSGGGEDDPFA